MLELSGGDAAALAEVRAALDLTVTQDNPDPGNALALAFCRDQLSDRNTNIPVSLPAVPAASWPGNPCRGPRNVHHQPADPSGCWRWRTWRWHW